MHHTFIGIAADPDLLPDIKGLDEARTLFPEAGFPDWPALLDHWRRSIEAVAREIRDGTADLVDYDVMIKELEPRYAKS